MKATALTLNTSVTVTHISTLHDQISNTLSTSLGKWSFEYKLYRENPASSSNPSSTDPSFLYLLHFSHYPGETFCLTSNGSSGSVVLQGDFDSMLNTKLQSLWMHRQTIKGEGNAYELNGGEIKLRMANMFLQGGYKGLIIEVDYENDHDEDKSEQEAIMSKINSTLSQFNITLSKDNNNDLKISPSRLETAWNYVETISR